MSALTGTVTLARFALRCDRIRIPVWLTAIGVLVLATASSIRGLYPTQASLDSAAAVVEGNAAAIVANGPVQGLDTVGGRIAFELGSFTAVLIALMSLLLVARHTRTEEETGRTELVRAGAVGRHAPTVAALLVVAVAVVLAGGVVAAGLAAQGLPVTGSVALGVSLASVGLVFAGVAAVAAQLTEHARTATGIGLAVLGAAFVLRAAGDVGDGTLSWLSPIGWGQAIRPFAGELWWPLLLPAAATALLVAAAFVLGARRDVGFGLVPTRPGRPAARGGLLRPVGLALRLQRGLLLAWASGVFLVGLAYGSVGRDIEQFVADNAALADALRTSGSGDITDSFFGTALLVLALIGSGFAIQATLRLRAEEGAGRAEPVLAAGVGRARWAGSHLTVALLGSGTVVAAGGLGTGVGFGLATGEVAEVPRLLGAALVHVPPVWVLVGVTAALFGLVPRLAALAWAALAVAVVGGMFGPLLGLPGWLLDASPFQHVPALPAAELAVAPLLVLGAVAAVLLAGGLAGFRRRDVG